MDDVRKLVKGRLSALGLDMAEVSRRVGKNQTYIQQFLTRNSPRVLPEDVRAELSRILGVPESSLKVAQVNSGPNLPRNKVSSSTIKTEQYPFSGHRDLPVLGAARGGLGGTVFVDNGNPIEYVDRPSDLYGNREAYGVYVVGESMWPRYIQGEIVFANPHRPVSKDDYVVVAFWNEDRSEREYTIKQFVRQDQRRLKLRQLNDQPPEFDLPMERVIHVHRIVWKKEIS